GGSGGGPFVAPGAGGARAGGAGAGGAPMNGASLPCAVATVLKTRCQLCHGATPLNGAPMPLVSYADTQAASASDPATPVWKAMQTRVHSTGMKVMPPRGQPALSATELASLEAWFTAGAPAGTAACTGGTGGAGGS